MAGTQRTGKQVFFTNRYFERREKATRPDGTGFATRAVGDVLCRVELEIDLQKLFADLGERAFRSSRKKASALHGAIKATVREV